MNNLKDTRLKSAGAKLSTSKKPVLEQFEPRFLLSGGLLAENDSYSTAQDAAITISPLENDSIRIGGPNGEGSYTQNGITISWSGSQTPGLDGYTAWTVTASAAEGVFLGFDVEFTADEIHHEAPFGVASTWVDNLPQIVYDLYPDVEKGRDTYFLFNGSDLLTMHQGESETSLSAAFAITNDDIKQDTLNIANIVLPNGETFSLTGSVVTQDGSGPHEEVNISGTLAMTGEADIAGFTQTDHGTVVDNGDGTFTYTPDAGYFGADSFTYTISDGYGGSDSAEVSLNVSENAPAENTAPAEEVEPAENVAPAEEVAPVEEVAPAEEVGPVAYSLSFRSGQKFTFIDSTGDLVTVRLSGPGTGEIWLTNGDSGDATELSLTGTTRRSKLKISVKKTRNGQNETFIGELDVDGSLRSISASRVNLVGDMEISGKIKFLKLGNVDSGSEIDLNTDNASVTSKDRVKITLGSVQGADLDTHGLAIVSLSAVEWLGGDGSQIVASRISRLTIKGNFGADILLDGEGARKTTLGKVKIKGNLTSDLWDVYGNIGNVSVRGAVLGTDSQRVTVRSTGNMGSLKFGSVEKADFLAGIARNGKTNADSASDFVNPWAYIKSVKIKGIKGSSSRFFTDSTFSAARFKKISLLNLDAANPGGIFALDTDSVNEIRSIKHKDRVTRQKWSWSTRSRSSMPGPSGFIELL